MPDADGIIRVDLTSSDLLEVKIIKQNGMYKLWVNGPNGMLLRAYNIRSLAVDLDDWTLLEAIEEHKENNPGHSLHKRKK